MIRSLSIISCAHFVLACSRAHVSHMMMMCNGYTVKTKEHVTSANEERKQVSVLYLCLFSRLQAFVLHVQKSFLYGGVPSSVSRQECS